MKVLFATYPMAFHTPGGGEIQLLAYREQLSAMGIEVALFDQWAPRLLDYDVVHFFSTVGGSGHFCAFVKQLGLPLVVSSSLWITEATRHLYPAGEIEWQLQLADKIVANSDLECDGLSALFQVRREKFETVHNGVADTYFAPSDPQVAAATFGLEGQRYVLNVGNIEPRKNQLRLAQAMRSFPDLKLLLLGHVRDPAYLTQVLAQGGSQIIFPGAVPPASEVLKSAYAGCAVFALPSVLETPGLAALEAGAQGARVIVTNEGSAREYFEDGAIYVDPLSVDAITSGLADGLKEGDRGRTLAATLRRFSWDKCCARLPAIYEGAIKASAVAAQRSPG